MKKILLITISLFSLLNVSSIFCQKLESDGFIIKLEEYNIDESEMPLLGKQTIIYGIVSVAKDSIVYKFRYYAPVMNNVIKDVALRDLDDKELFPKLWYNENDNSFRFDNNFERAKKSSNNKNIILSGVLIYSKYYLE
jgi:hypothetical protein